VSIIADNTLPGEIRLPLYLSARYLQELELALRLAGVRVRYERPGTGGIMFPRLSVECPQQGDSSRAICATPQRPGGRQVVWCFEWRSLAPFGRSPRTRRMPERICPAVDMNRAARIIAGQLRDGST
jgi:hypothetical protein